MFACWSPIAARCPLAVRSWLLANRKPQRARQSLSPARSPIAIPSPIPMRLPILATAAIAAAGGYAFAHGRTPAVVPDEHANHADHSASGAVLSLIHI